MASSTHDKGHRKLLFPLGALVLTAGVDRLMRENGFDPLPYFRRHARGDWGDLCEDDRRTNDAALKNGGRLFSSYQVAPDLKLWIITEWDRSETTLLLPDEY